MAVYQYRATDSAGRLIEGVMEADAERGVISRLHELGFIPLRIAAPGEAVGRRFHENLPLFSRDRVSQQQLLHFTQEISTLLAAGLPLDRSLSVLSNLVEGEGFKKIVRLLLEGVRAGKSLSATMAEHTEVFPRIYVNMIRAGEAGGVVESVLRYLGEYLERSLELKEEIKSALIYPVVVLCVAGFSLIMLFVFVIPRFIVLFKDVEHALPWLTRMVIGFSFAVSSYGWIGILLAAAAAAWWTFYVRNPEGRLQWDRLRLRFWVVGDLLRKLEVARFSRTLAALLRGGVPLLEALGTVQGIVGNRLLARAVGQVQSRVREGKGMIGPLSESGVFPPLALHMIAVGEETGRMESMLTSVADHYDLEVKRATKRLTSLLEPALIIGMGLLIGVVVLSMLMAILSIYDLPS